MTASRWYWRWGPATVVCVVLPLAMIRGVDPNPNLPEDKETTKLLQEAKQIEEKRKIVGAELLKVLKDRNQKLTTIEREDILLALGELRHDSAIEYTVSQLTTLRAFRPDAPRSPTTVMSWEERYPAIRALWNYGTPAVPALVKAYVERKKEAVKQKGGGGLDVLIIAIVHTLGHPSLSGYTLNYLEELLARTQWTVVPEAEVLKELQDEVAKEINRRRGLAVP